MPEEVFIIAIVFILFVLAPAGVFKGIRGLRETRSDREGGRRAGGDVMRKSELQAMIDDAVIEATEPLVARIDELERAHLLGDGRLDASVLEEALTDPDEQEPGRPHRPRTR